MTDDSVIARRIKLGGEHFNGDRDVYETCGYPRELDVKKMRERFDRGDIAHAIVTAYPDATWREKPPLKAPEAITAQWNALDKRLGLWGRIKRLDTLTQLGHYGVLLLGLDGGEPLDTPATGSNYKLLYAQPHSSRTAEITEWETNTSSPRFGAPKTYRITTGNEWTGTGGGQRVLTVHHSRVIHVVDGALESDYIGEPLLQRGYNRLMDIEKLAGGSAEIFWQNAAQILAFIASADAEFDEKDAEKMQSQIDEMQHKLRRALRLRGVDVKNIAAGLQGSTPRDHFNVQIDLLAATYRVPKRILIGNEAGELASTQDETAWQSRIAERRTFYADPCVLHPLISRLQQFGVLPSGDVEIDWPETDALGEKGRAEVAEITSRAVNQYTAARASGGEDVLAPDEFRNIFGLGPLRLPYDGDML